MKRLVLEKIIGIAVFTGLLILIADELSFFHTARNISFEEPAREKLSASAQALDSAFSKIKIVTDSIFGNIEGESLEKASVQKQMEKLVNLYPIDGLFFAFENKDIRNSYALLFSKCSGFIEVPNLFEESVDNQYKKWYYETYEKGQAWWIDPVSEKLFGERIVGCCLPLSLKGGEKGFAMIIYNSTRIYERLQQFGLSRYGLPYIMDSTTVFIAHPLDETRSLGQLGEDYADHVLVRLTEDLTIRKKLKDDYIHRNTVTGQLCKENFAPINETGWLLGLSVYDGGSLESKIYQYSMKCCLIHLLLLGSLWIIVVIFFISQWLKKQACFSYILPFLFFGIIIGIIAAYNRFPVNNYSAQGNYLNSIFEQIKINQEEQDFLNKYKIYNKWDPQRIVDYNSLYKFIDRYREESLKLYDDPVKIIPTGLYLHSIQFVNSYEIRVSGILWQKFEVSDTGENNKSIFHSPDYPGKGILFPGAQINEYEQTDTLFAGEKKMVLYRWNFDINIPQQLSYSLFPFGKNNITLPLWSVNLDDNTILIPDMESYKQLYPDVCPGLGNNFKINGWNILSTYYSYAMESYLCNFGNTDIYGINRFPELMFNISVSREFINSLVCKIIPIGVVLVFLFTILFVRDNSDGFNNIIGCSGLFFVLVFDHINLRETVLSDGIMYLEYCYFFTYVLLLLVTLTSFQSENNVKVKEYLQGSNRMLKRFFWIFVFGTMAITTLFIFY
jgi:hypothetical protein